MTTADCVRYTKIRVELFNYGFQMRLGTSNLWNPTHGILRNVIDIAYHPDYKAGKYYFDVGIAIANEEIEITNTVMPICLPKTPDGGEDVGSGVIWPHFNYPIVLLLYIINLGS